MLLSPYFAKLSHHIAGLGFTDVLRLACTIGGILKSTNLFQFNHSFSSAVTITEEEREKAALLDRAKAPSPEREEPKEARKRGRPRLKEGESSASKVNIFSLDLISCPCCMFTIGGKRLLQSRR